MTRVLLPLDSQTAPRRLVQCFLMLICACGISQSLNYKLRAHRLHQAIRFALRHGLSILCFSEEGKVSSQTSFNWFDLFENLFRLLQDTFGVCQRDCCSAAVSEVRPPRTHPFGLPIMDQHLDGTRKAIEKPKSPVKEVDSPLAN